LGQELLVEQSQPLLLLEDVLTVESLPFSSAVRLLLFLYLLFHLVECMEELIFALLRELVTGMGSYYDEEPESSMGRS